MRRGRTARWSSLPPEIERELREGTSPSWVDQEYRVAFTAALQSSIYAEDLSRAHSEQRIVSEVGYDRGMPVQVGVDLGLTGAAVVAQGTAKGTWINVLWAWAWEDKALPEVITTIRALPYEVSHWVGPHDLEQRSDVTGEDRLAVARRLGVAFTVVPRVARIEERIDLVRRKFPMLRFDSRGSAPLLEALQHYRRKWNDKLKTFDAEPVHDKHSHLADAFGTLLSGWRSQGQRTGPREPARGVVVSPSRWGKL
jgi:phage terminase large subunit